MEPTPEARLLAERALRGADHDWERLFEIRGEGMIFAGQPRHGVRCMVVRDYALADPARDALLAWRFAQYLLVNFYDTALVRDWLREPRHAVGPHDSHAMAFDSDWQLVAYGALERPSHMRPQWRFGDAERSPLVPCELVHGREWQRGLNAGRDIHISQCCEMGRSMTDQRRQDITSHRAAIELALLACQLVHRAPYNRAIRLVTGDLDPGVILNNLRYLFIPVATWPPRKIDLGDGHPLRPRYLNNPTAPFLVLLQDIGSSSFLRWADIDCTMELRDEQASPRLRALRQFRSMQESSCRLPRTESEPPWESVVLGPGEEVDSERAAWVITGSLQALYPCPAGWSHLASMGPGVAYEPGADAEVTRIHAVSPARVLTASREEFAQWNKSGSAAS